MAKKIERDKTQREARAKARAEHEAKKGEGLPSRPPDLVKYLTRAGARAFVIMHKYQFARCRKFVHIDE